VKILSVMLFLSMMIINMQAGDPEHKKFNYGSFFSGVATGYGIPICAWGHFITSAAKKDLMKSGTAFSERLAKDKLATGRTLRGVGLALILIPLLVNNRRLLMNKVNKY